MRQTVVPERLAILGIPVDLFASPHNTVEHVAGRIRGGLKTFCVAINPEKGYRALRDPVLFETLRKADMCICDGIGIVYALMILYRRRIPRCTGVQLFFDLVAHAPAAGWKVFLLGASPQSNAGATQKLVQRNPGLQIVGRHDGYFEDAGRIISLINDSGADLVFVAMGSPRQEFWIAEHLHEIHAAFFMGVGGSFDVASGTAPWAPAIFRKTGTEFIFRLVTDPKRWRRLLPQVAFAVEVVRRRLFGEPPRTG